MENILIHHTFLPPQYTTNKAHFTTKNNIDKWLQYNPNLNLKQRLWFGDEAISFLTYFSEKYGYDVLNVYNKEHDGRYKSDILRLCILYEYGGFYADVDQEPILPIDRFFDVNNYDFCAAANMGLHNVSNGFLFARQNSNIIKENIIELIRTYDNNIPPGGTHIMGRVITKLINGEEFKMPLGDILINGERCLFLHEIGDESLPSYSPEFFNSFGLYANNDTLRVMNSRYVGYGVDKYKMNEYIDLC